MCLPLCRAGGTRRRPIKYLLTNIDVCSLCILYIYVYVVLHKEQPLLIYDLHQGHQCTCRMLCTLSTVIYARMDGVVVLERIEKK